MIKPDAYDLRSEIMAYVQESGLNIKYSEELRLEKAEVEYLYLQHKSQPFYKELVPFMTGKKVVIMALEMPQPSSAISTWRKLIGPTDPARAVLEQPDSIRGRFWRRSADARQRRLTGQTQFEQLNENCSFFFRGRGLPPLISKCSG
jgi:nucleoside-diphosphate kinase